MVDHTFYWLNLIYLLVVLCCPFMLKITQLIHSVVLTVDVYHINHVLLHLFVFIYYSHINLLLTYVFIYIKLFLFLFYCYELYIICCLYVMHIWM